MAECLGSSIGMKGMLTRSHFTLVPLGFGIVHESFRGILQGMSMQIKHGKKVGVVYSLEYDRNSME